MARNITIIGGIIMDLMTVTDRLAAVGESKLATSIDTIPGGKGANSAVAAYRASHGNPAHRSSSPTGRHELNVRMMGAVGDDTFGHACVQALTGTGIDVSGVRTIAGEKTGVYSVTVESSSGNNWLYLVEGATKAIAPSDFVTFALPNGSKPDLIVLNLEIRQDTVERVLELARSEGIAVLVNPAPARHLARELYGKMRHIVMNETEAAMLAGRPLEDVALMTDKVDLVGLNSLTDHFLALGVANVVITLGEHGAFYSNAQGQGRHVPAVANVDVKDPTGAGDTFVGTYAVEVVQHQQQQQQQQLGLGDGSGAPPPPPPPATPWPMRAAVERGCRAAARTITRVGARDGIPWADELSMD